MWIGVGALALLVVGLTIFAGFTTVQSANHAAQATSVQVEAWTAEADQLGTTQLTRDIVASLRR